MAQSVRTALRILALAAMAGAALTVLWLVFSIRYIWYLDASTAFAMRSGFAMAALAIVLCWFFAPSRTLVGALGLIALFFPLLVGLTTVPVNAGFLPFVAFAVALLVAATHLRRKL